jgi:3-oxoacyl-[acyl-carrier-protein] synthase-3
MKMEGPAVFNWAASHLSDNIQEILDAAELKPQDVDLYIPHQANIRIINAAIDVLGIDRSRVFNNLDKYGNTSAGSIPLALDEAVQEGRVKPGSTICLSGFGSGLVWGTAIVRW